MFESTVAGIALIVAFVATLNLAGIADRMEEERDRRRRDDLESGIIRK